MAHLSPASNTLRPPRRAARHRDKNGHVVQFLLLVSAAAIVSSLVAWKVYRHQGSWREWSMSMRSGLLGMHSGRPGEAGGEGIGGELEAKSIRYLGEGYADLGEYSIGRYDWITNTTLTVEFRLKGVTPCLDEASFNTFMHRNERAFRDRVTQAVRDCTASDYTDAKALSNKVVVRVNRAFSGRFLDSAELADFDVFESVGTYQTESWQTAEQAAAGM